MSPLNQSSRSFQQRGNINKWPYQSSSLPANQNISSETPEKQSQVQSSAQPSTIKAPDTQQLTSRSLTKQEPVEDSSQLALILVKLNELEAIKTHLTTIDIRLNLLQPQTSHIATVTQRS